MLDISLVANRIKVRSRSRRDRRHARYGAYYFTKMQLQADEYKDADELIRMLSAHSAIID